MSKKVKLTKKDIEHMADLAKLSLNKEEISDMATQLEKTIGYVDSLEKLDTSETTPTNNIGNNSNVFFEDGAVNEKGLTQSQALSQAKRIEQEQFLVDKII
jgi:aspartyl-tRNA(Asn)/glutamyl-tRNA(Gln) amidotransferase subunit C